MTDAAKHVIPMTVDTSLKWIRRAIERGDLTLARLMFDELLDLVAQPAELTPPPPAAA